MQKNISIAFEDHLLNMPDGLPESSTAFENLAFTPIQSKPYQQVRLIPLPSENPTLGDGYYRDVGFFQVTLSYPKGVGRGGIADQADKIKAYFKRGTTLVEGQDKIIIDRTPQVSSVYINDTRAEVNVRIQYYCEQFT